MAGALVDAGRLFRACWPRLLVADLLYKALGFVLLAPLSGLVLQALVSTSGSSALADQDILFFAFTLRGVMALTLAGGVVLAVAAIDQASLMCIGFGAVRGQQVSALSALLYAMRQGLDVLAVALRMLVRTLLIAIPFVALGGVAYWVLLTEFDINFYLAERPPAFWAAGGVAAALVAGFAGVVIPKLAGWAYALPILLFEDVRIGDALAASERRSMGHRRSVALLFLVWLAASAAVSFFVLGGVTGVGRWMVPRLGESLPLLVVALGGLVLLWSVANVVVSFFQAASLALLVVAVYDRLGEPAEKPHVLSELGVIAPVGLSFRLSLRTVGWGMAALTVLSAGVGAYLLRTVRLEDDVAVIAHRGASAAAPENTLAALERALADGADQIEIDVQETADGVVVVMHDADFKRLSRNPLNIWDATSADLAQIDIGSWFAPEFSRERVPTLLQVLELSRGRAVVNIELKFYGRDERLEERVVEVVEGAGMADAVVVMSLKYAAVQKMRTLRPDWTLGLLTATAVGDLTTRDADFLAVNTGLATRSFLSAAHRGGKDVYVWTVNDPVDMWHLIGTGVDGLITDEPALAREVLARRAEMGSAERLLMSLALLLGKPLQRPTPEPEA